MTKKALKQLLQFANQLRVVILIGNHGLSANVGVEIEQALTRHELLKIKINSDDRDERNAIMDKIIELTCAVVVQKIGKVVVIFRKAKQDSNFNFVN